MPQIVQAPGVPGGARGVYRLVLSESALRLTPFGARNGQNGETGIQSQASDDDVWPP